MIKRLEPKSIYAKYDINQDGTVSDEEIARNKELLELELKEEKSEEHRKIAWVAMLCIIILLIILRQSPRRNHHTHVRCLRWLDWHIYGSFNMDESKVAFLQRLVSFCKNFYLYLVLMVALTIISGYLVGLLIWWEWDA